MLQLLIFRSLSIDDISSFEQLIIAIGYCFLMLILAILFYKFPPKKINDLYGYRTTRSMKNQEIWDAANTYWTLLFLKLCVVSFIIPLLVYYIYPTFNVLITAVVSTLLLLITIPITEKYLNNNFDKEGNRL